MASAFARPVYVPSVAARLLASLHGHEATSGEALAQVPEAGSEWYAVALSNGPAPGVLLAFGALCALGTGLNLARPARAPKTESTRPLLCAGMLLLAGLWLLAFVALRVTLQGYVASASALAEAANAARRTQEDAVVLNATAIQLRGQLVSLLDACPGLEELLARSMGGEGVQAAHHLQAAAAGELTGYGSLLMGARPGLSVLAGLLGAGSTRISTWPSLVLYCFMSPVKLAAVCAVTFVALHVARGLGHGVGAAVESVGPGRVAAGLAAATILACAAAAAALLGLAASAGTFCCAPDSGVVSLAGSAARFMGAEAFALGVARFYLYGVGHNPVLISLGEARARAQVLRNVLAANDRLLTTLGLFCLPVQEMNGTSTAATLLGTVQRDLDLLGGPSMYRLYSQAVPEGFCGSPLEALLWLAVFQALVGLIALPLVAAFARPYVGQGAIRSPTGSPTPGMEAGPLEASFADRRGPLISRDEGRALESARLLGAEGGGNPKPSGSGTQTTSSGPGGGGPTVTGASSLGHDGVDWAARIEEQRTSEVMASLLESRADIHSMTLGGRSLLDTACSTGDVEFLREASRRGSPISTWDFARAYGSYVFTGLTGQGPSLERHGGGAAAGSSSLPPVLRSAPAGAFAEHGDEARGGRRPARPRSSTSGGAAAAAGAAAPGAAGEHPRAPDVLATFVPKKKEEEAEAAVDRKMRFDEKVQDVMGADGQGKESSWWPLGR